MKNLVIANGDTEGQIFKSNYCLLAVLISSNCSYTKACMIDENIGDNDCKNEILIYVS